MVAKSLPQDGAILETKNERLLSTRQAAEASGYHQTYFNSQIVAGKLPASKDEKGRWQIKQSDLDKFLASKSVKPLRSKEITKYDDDNAPAKSLLTQIDEKEKKIKDQQFELEASKRIIEDLKSKHDEQITEFRHAVSEGENKLNRAKNRIENLKTENQDLKEENREHTDFLRTTIKDLLQYVTK